MEDIQYNQDLQEKYKDYVPEVPAAASMRINTPTIKSNMVNDIFKGEQPLQYLLWANNLVLASGINFMVLGFFTSLWADPPIYDCEVDGTQISSIYISPNNNGGTCDPTNETCCDPSDPNDRDLNGDVGIGVFYFFLGLFIMIFENPYWGWGLYHKVTSFSYQNGISIRAVLYGILSLPGLGFFPVALACIFLLSSAIAFQIGTRNKEAGDGGRAERKRRKDKHSSTSQKNYSSAFSHNDEGEKEGWRVLDPRTWISPYQYYQIIKAEDRLSVHVWIFIYELINFAIFTLAFTLWSIAIAAQEDGLEDTTRLKTDCDSYECKVNEAVVEYGPVSGWAPWAKACGGCLNYNCALLLLPINHLLIKKINNAGISFTQAKSLSASFFARYFASPITRYIPLSKNIEFHKLIGKHVFIFAYGHMVYHWFNYYYSSETTLAVFGKLGWSASAYFTGCVISLAMFYIYTAATPGVKNSNFEIFFYSHHWFTVFFFFLLLHGPVFYLWALIPILLYMYERYMQKTRGLHPWVVTRVEWISPVIALRICPTHANDFKFTEGQYLYLNCPYISEREWHPFTISSASDTLTNGPRVSIETGEEVVEVPRPSNWPKEKKWNKYCLISEDWRNKDPNDLLEKWETAYHDYLSLHIKVFGLNDAVARSWTRKLKEYFEILSPSDSFPYYYTSRDERGEQLIGRFKGPDGKPILRVDGPHSAPAEHYSEYNTVMLIGAGIGLTPCSSILSALMQYRWRKNFRPELLHFYWIVPHKEVKAFQWFVHRLTELEYRLKLDRERNQIEERYYCEINIYVTSYKGETSDYEELYYQGNKFIEAKTEPFFTASELYHKLLNPTVSSKGQIETMKNNPNSENRLQDIWIWNGRPNWDEIFANNSQQRIYKDIGVCFCGAPVIGRDLKKMCRKYSSIERDCIFTLHKENF